MSPPDPMIATEFVERMVIERNVEVLLRECIRRRGRRFARL